MKKISFFSIFIVFLLVSCKSMENKKQPGEVLFYLGDQPFYSDEFTYVYNKNNFNDTLPLQESVDNYLDLFIKFKLKVKEAEELGLQNTEEFINEFNTYKEQLIQPYLTESEVTEQLVKEAYQRLQEEINVSHILIKVPSPAQPEDTLAAYKKIQEIREKAAGGESFEKLAKNFSEDPSAAQNGGHLGYFTALQMVYPFENMAYQTNEGEISAPVRTRFGYHIIKVHDRRATQGKVKVSHIMIRNTAGSSDKDSLNARKTIFSLYQKLQQGENWNDLCSRYSEDLNSKSKGGELPWIGTGNIYPSFESAAFALEEPGDISKPVKTPYGWHLIKLDEKKGLGSFDELKEEIEQKVKRDSRSEVNREILLKRLKEENNFKEVTGLNSQILNEADSALLIGEWTYNINASDLNDVLFQINDSAYFVGDFYEYAVKNQKTVSNITPRYYLKMLYNDFVAESNIQYEKDHLADKYKDYRRLVQEYKEGILLFQLMEEKVWSKAIEDSTGLMEFFENNKLKYHWDKRLQAVIYEAGSADVISEVKKYLDKEFITLPGSEKVLTSINNETGLDQETQSNLDDIARETLENDHYVCQIKVNLNENNKEKINKIIDYLTEKGLKESKIKLSESGNDQIIVSYLSRNKALLSEYFDDLHVTEGKFEKGDNYWLSEVEWKNGSYYIEKDNQYVLVEVNDVLEPSFAQLKEVKGKVISDYQEYLESRWIEELKKKYPVEINRKALRKIYKNIENI